MILRLLNAQGIAGIVVGLALAVLLVVQKAETGHWKKQSGQFERLYRDSERVLATVVADTRAADRCLTTIRRNQITLERAVAAGIHNPAVTR